MSGPDRIWAFYSDVFGPMWTAVLDDGATEYIRRDPAVIAALPEVQAIVDAAVKAALDDVTTLHRVIADIRTETVGHKPMLSELPQALVQWRDAAVKAEREACVASLMSKHKTAMNAKGRDASKYQSGWSIAAAAIRKRGEGEGEV